MTLHYRWLHIKIPGEIILYDPPFPNHCYPASWVMKSTLFFTVDGHPSSIAAVSPAPIPHRAEWWKWFWRLKKTVLTKWQKKAKEVIFHVKDQGKKHHLLLQWHWLYGLLKDITLVHFWLRTNVNIKIYSEIKATSNKTPLLFLVLTD